MLLEPCARCSAQGVCPESTNEVSQDAMAGPEGLLGTLLTDQGGGRLDPAQGMCRACANAGDPRVLAGEQQSGEGQGQVACGPF